MEEIWQRMKNFALRFAFFESGPDKTISPEKTRISDIILSIDGFVDKAELCGNGIFVSPSF